MKPGEVPPVEEEVGFDGARLEIPGVAIVEIRANSVPRALQRRTHRGALILYIYGIGWEGTPAATWYFRNRVYPEMVAGTRSWNRYLLVEWTDANGNITKDEADTWTVLATDVP